MATDTPTNIPLDSNILIDTDYIRQYLNDMGQDLVLDEVDEDENDKWVLDTALTDPDDPRFDAIIDKVVDIALEDNKLRNLIADTVHQSWLWEYLSDMIDDVTVDFLHDAVAEAKSELNREKELESALTCLVDALAQGNERDVQCALERAQSLTKDTCDNERNLDLFDILPDSGDGRMVVISATNWPEIPPASGDSQLIVIPGTKPKN